MDVDHGEEMANLLLSTSYSIISQPRSHFPFPRFSVPACPVPPLGRSVLSS